MQRKAFTLIELLVVIAIIAILAAILFPVFAQAKNAAKSSADLSNVKQLALGMELFKADHDGHYPKAWFNDEIGGQQTGQPEPLWGWDVNIMPYVKSRDLFRSPLDSESFPRGLGTTASTPLIQQPGNVNLGPMGTRHTEDDIPASYRYNISNMDHQFTALNESGLEFPAEAIVIVPSVPGAFEANWHQITTSVDNAFQADDYPRSGVCIDKSDNVDYDRNSAISKTPTPPQRKQGRANYGFGDGHAKSFAFGATWKRIGGAADVITNGRTVTPTMWRQRFASPVWWVEVCAFREGETPR